MKDNSKLKIIVGAVSCVVIVLAVCITAIVVTVSRGNTDSSKAYSGESTLYTEEPSQTQDANDGVVNFNAYPSSDRSSDNTKKSDESEKEYSYVGKTSETTKAYSTTAPSTVNQTPTAAGSYAQSDFFSQEYLFPSDTTYLTDEILSRYTREQIRFITNEMYARHGLIFSKEPYKSYFASKSWYYGTDTSMQVVVERFNGIEKANLEIIADYERAQGWRKTQSTTENVATQQTQSDKAYENFEVGTVCMIDYTTPLHDGLNLRSEATKDSELLRLLNEGTELVIQEKFDSDNNAYIYVSYYDGESGETVYGWILASYLVEV